jgi:hypothetical protein
MFVRITLNRLGGDIVAVGHANALRSYDFAGKPSFWITSSEGMIDSYKRGWCPAPFLPAHHPYAAVNFSTCKLPRPCSACHKS